LFLAGLGGAGQERLRVRVGQAGQERLRVRVGSRTPVRPLPSALGSEAPDVGGAACVVAGKRHDEAPRRAAPRRACPHAS